MLQFLDIGAGADARRIAVLVRAGEGPPAVWLGGFRSDMLSTKAEALDAWAAEKGRAFLRFDYSGHGESTGLFEESTISRWLEDTLAVQAYNLAADERLAEASTASLAIVVVGLVPLAIAARRLVRGEPRTRDT